MRPTLTTRADAPGQAANNAVARTLAWMLGAAVCAALLTALVYQIPAAHTVDIGGLDAAYTQGFFEAERADLLNAPPYLAGSDGRARWSGAPSFLIFPQIGLPAELSLRMRAKPDQTPDGELIVLLNSTTELGRIRPTNDWQEYKFILDSGLLKPNDVVIELRATSPSAISADDGRIVGALLDRAALRTHAWPITPYPAQLVLAAVAGALAGLVFMRWNVGVMVGFSVGLATAFLLLYRLQMPYSYPLRGLLVWTNLVLAAAVVLRYGPRLADRVPALLDVAALGGTAVWLAALLRLAQQHVVLSRPGVETDFRVFALRSEQLLGVFQPGGNYDAASDGVLRADGFYNLGYPLLLWLVRPLTNDNAFLAGRIIAAASGAVLLVAGWWLARQMLGRGPALVALLCLAFSPFVVQYGMYVGTDTPFAATCAVALALLIGGYQRSLATDDTATPHWSLTLPLFGAGLAAGAAFLFRHPGLLLLPFGWLVITVGGQRRHLRVLLLLFTLGFMLATLPQLAVNIRDTGNPLYSQQAKNIWLAVYGNSDWANWERAPNSISLAEVVLADPLRFANNWLTNLRGFVGAGGEDFSEFGRADQLRLLAFPANWLAVLTLALWLFGRHAAPSAGSQERTPQLLLTFAALYVVGVSVGLGLLRFALPLTPIYALAAAGGVCWLARRGGSETRPYTLLTRPYTLLTRPYTLLTRPYTLLTRPYALLTRPLLIGLALAVMLWPGFVSGTGFVLANQPADERAAVEMIQRHVGPEARVRMELDKRTLFDTYSAVAHLTAAPNQPAAYALRQTSAAAHAGETAIDSAGGYTLYQPTP